MEISRDNLDDSLINDVMSIACSNCQFMKFDKISGYRDCFAGSDPTSSKCPFSAEIETRLDDALETCGQILEEAMKGAAM